MNTELAVGLRHSLTYRVPDDRTVPDLLPEAAEFVASPRVFATGYLVAFLEWACKQAVHPLLQPGDHTVGTRVDVTHEAATPPGVELTAQIELIEIDGRRLVFRVEAYDAEEVVSRGIHERVVVNRARFDAKVDGKRDRLSGKLDKEQNKIDAMLR